MHVRSTLYLRQVARGWIQVGRGYQRWIQVGRGRGSGERKRGWGEVTRGRYRYRGWGEVNAGITKVTCN